MSFGFTSAKWFPLKSWYEQNTAKRACTRTSRCDYTLITTNMIYLSIHLSMCVYVCIYIYIYIYLCIFIFIFLLTINIYS